MFASPDAPKYLCSLYESAGFVSLMSLESISEVLRERRKDLERTDRYLSGSAMSSKLRERFGKLGRSQGWISLLETGAASADIMTLQPEVRLYLLELYAFTATEIVELDKRFDLKLLSSTMKNFTPQPLFPSVSMDTAALKSLGNSNGDGYTLLTLQQLGGHVAENCFTIIAGGSVLACDKVKQRLEVGDTAYFDSSLTPRDGDLIAYRVTVEGKERFLIAKHRLEQPLGWITSYDSSVAVYIQDGDPKLERIGVQWWYHSPQRNG